MTDQPLIAYVFVNRYLSGIQAGIQAAHALVDLERNNAEDSLSRSIYETWADDHATLIVKNGGDSEAMLSDCSRAALACMQLGLPMSAFFEPGMNGLMTAYAFVVPKSVVDWKDQREIRCLLSNPPQYVKVGELSKREQAFQTLAELIQSRSLMK